MKENICTWFNARTYGRTLLPIIHMKAMNNDN